MTPAETGTPAETVRRYYDALREGEPLAPFFLESPDVVKFGVGERLTGYDEVANGLDEQTRTTADWTVESRNLRTLVREDHAAFSDDVSLVWNDVDAGRERSHETRWSGTLSSTDDGWRFLGMHVSIPHED